MNRSAFQIILMAGVAFSAGFASAQSSDRFSITRSSIGQGGADVSTSSRFVLSGTVSQPVISSPAGSRFSIRDGFWAWPSPALLATKSSGDKLLLSFPTERGKTYSVLGSDSLSSANWKTLSTVIGDGATQTVTNAPGGATIQFYRVLEQ